MWLSASPQVDDISLVLMIQKSAARNKCGDKNSIFRKTAGMKLSIPDNMWHLQQVST